MVQDIHGSLDEDDIPFGIDMVARDPGDLGKILRINVMIHDNQSLGKHHLPHAPEGVHDLARMGRVFLFDRDNRQVVKNAVNRQIHIDDLRKCQPQQRQKDSLRRFADIGILHRRAADDGGRINGILFVRDAGDVKYRIVVGKRIEAGVVAERSFSAQRLRRDRRSLR